MKFTALTPDLYDYLAAHGHNSDPVRDELIAETEKLGPISLMQIAPEQGTLLNLLVRVTGTRSIRPATSNDTSRSSYSTVPCRSGVPDRGRHPPPRAPSRATAASLGPAFFIIRLIS